MAKLEGVEMMKLIASSVLGLAVSWADFTPQGLADLIFRHRGNALWQQQWKGQIIDLWKHRGVAYCLKNSWIRRHWCCRDACSGWMWWYVPLIPASRKQRPVSWRPAWSPYYTVRSCFKTSQDKTNQNVPWKIKSSLQWGGPQYLYVWKPSVQTPFILAG